MSSSRAGVIYKSTSRAGKAITVQKRKATRARQNALLRQAAGDVIITPASQVATVIPGTYRTSNLWAMGVRGSGESKYYDFRDDGTFSANTWKIQSLITIPSGDTATSRDGRMATVTNFHINGYLVGNAGGYVVHRVVVLIDKQANGALPSASDVFITTATTGGSVSGLYAYRNLDNTTRFEILYDKKHIVAPSIAGMANPPVKQFKISRKKTFNVEWSGTSGATSTIRSNNLVVMTFVNGDVVPTSPNDDKWRWLARVRYLDG